jgi:hypothetical protein
MNITTPLVTKLVARLKTLWPRVSVVTVTFSDSRPPVTSA